MADQDPPQGAAKVSEEDIEAGAGVYSNLAEYVMRSTEAQASVLILLGGNYGTGFDIAVRPECLDNVNFQALAEEMERCARILRDRAEILLRAGKAQLEAKAAEEKDPTRMDS